MPGEHGIPDGYAMPVKVGAVCLVGIVRIVGMVFLVDNCMSGEDGMSCW